MGQEASGWGPHTPWARLLTLTRICCAVTNKTITSIINGLEGHMLLHKVIYPSTGVIRYYDSLGEKPILRKRIAKKWSEFMQRRRELHLEQEMDKVIYQVPILENVIRQMDCHNCGVFALRFLYKEITRTSLNIPSTERVRWFLANTLHTESGHMLTMQNEFSFGVYTTRKRGNLICYFC
ncbi:hypothetical protein ScPMuIL_017950 [Solemya velum]